ncbi:MAG TPA: response regulator [Blastocatellia bacterium]|jgi:CheY-like chemotaxis protein|nr:response regulator [Blastocatellia bacterium]
MSSKAEPRRGKDPDSRNKEDTASARPGRASQGVKGVRSQVTRPKVLIADDSKDIREYLSKLLEKQFSVTTAADGRACLNKASVEPPNCIVTDVNMPHLNGIDTIKILRRDPRLGQIPIIAISAYGNWAVAKALEAGATMVMLKPLEPDDFIENIRTLTGATVT